MIWDDKVWTVADARYDDSGLAVGSHWHLTLVEQPHYLVGRDMCKCGREFGHPGAASITQRMKAGRRA